MEKREIFGYIGSAALLLGVFAPLLSIPIVGSVNYFQNGRGDGVFIVAFALLSLFLIANNKLGALWFTGSASIAVLGFTFVNFQLKLSETKLQMEHDLAGNPFRGIADVAVNSVQLQWGFAVLLLGACCLIVAAFIDPENMKNSNAGSVSGTLPKHHFYNLSDIKVYGILIFFLGLVLAISYGHLYEPSSESYKAPSHQEVTVRTTLPPPISLPDPLLQKKQALQPPATATRMATTADTELAKLRTEVIERMKESRASAAKMLALHEEERNRLAEDYERRKELYRQGLILRGELNQAERALAAAIVRVDEDKRWVAESDIPIKEAIPK